MKKAPVIICIAVVLSMWCFEVWAGLDCDGVDDVAAILNPSGLPTSGQVSGGCWINPDNIIPNDQDILCDADRSAAAFGSHEGWGFGLSNTDGEIFFVFFGSGSYNTTAMSVVDDEWQFIGFATDSSNDVKFYHYRPSTQTATTETITGTFVMNAINGGNQLSLCAVEQRDTDGGGYVAFYNGQVSDCFVYAGTMGDADFEKIYLSQIKGIARQVNQSNLKMLTLLDEEEDGTSADGDSFKDVIGGNILVGDNGANNTGMTAIGEQILSYP